MSAPTSPLRTFCDDDMNPLDVTAELRMTAEALERTASADICSDRDMIRTAVVLRMRLRSLAAAVLAERGEGQ
ncbi:hypothetical protein ABT167_28835 [Streptomyces sp. NPDC001792]|uniref:hypothetical protein n=1 Tax=Streptomyces sp. NPDC001792 TaxID=3154524 RepID=UPI0033330484